MGKPDTPGGPSSLPRPPERVHLREATLFPLWEDRVSPPPALSPFASWWRFSPGKRALPVAPTPVGGGKRKEEFPLRRTSGFLCPRGRSRAPSPPPQVGPPPLPPPPAAWVSSRAGSGALGILLSAPLSARWPPSPPGPVEASRAPPKPPFSLCLRVRVRVAGGSRRPRSAGQAARRGGWKRRRSLSSSLLARLLPSLRPPRPAGSPRSGLWGSRKGSPGRWLCVWGTP